MSDLCPICRDDYSVQPVHTFCEVDRTLRCADRPCDHDECEK